MSAASWADLRPRVVSGLAMVAVGALAIWLGGKAFGALAVLVGALMIWELASMTALPGRSRLEPVLLAVLAAAAMAAVLIYPETVTRALLLAPVILGALMPRRDRLIFAAYAFAVMAASYALIYMRLHQGAVVILWIIVLVVVSDVAGYFAGRMLGGPKFWPRVSPKKTWSGTLAGWLGGAVVGWLFTPAGAGPMLVFLTPLLAFAGQMGDIAESAIKRRMGVKDSSALIPGHGGVLDRFDALVGAMLVLLIVVQFVPLPFPRG